MTKVMPCTCQHKQQDDLHGVGNRVFNKTTKKVTDAQAMFRCTVCLKEKSAKV